MRSRGVMLITGARRGIGAAAARLAAARGYIVCLNHVRDAEAPDEVAQAILWLSGPESAYSTGTFIDVSGGM